jgi:hypothetical protein
MSFGIIRPRLGYTNTPTTLEEFVEALNRHDWYYQFADDFAVWSAGNTRDQMLLRLAREGDDQWKAAYNAAADRHYANPSFPNYTTPFPDVTAQD